MMKAVHFGAGNIGRGFIGALLSKSGYDVTFVDVNADIIQALKDKGSYTVLMAEENGAAEVISGVHALNSERELDAVVEAVAQADIVTTAVGPNILRFVAEPIAKGLEQKGNRPTLVIACENAIGATDTLRAHIEQHVDSEKLAGILATTSFPNSAVDRIVPNQQHEELLTVAVEPFFEWVIDASMIQTEKPKLADALFVPDLTPFIERKLFTVNTGHATVAYLGYQKGYTTIYEAMQDQEIVATVRAVLQETGYVLTTVYDFDKEEQSAYIDKVLNRFSNSYVSDELIRVGRSPLRKLSRYERFIKPAMMLLQLGQQPVALLDGIKAAFQFDVTEDAESVELQTKLKTLPLIDVVVEVTGLTKEDELVSLILAKLEA
ncbi:mannitol-1-phosphate 5-dehydrogenase [Metasolibacillus sp.]|uniref:mannitol-1-phosphate 5-dehydrogenase n=1 Tax=Metasolibacillus sp. TaxID=2703680 RepID=UPI0025CE3255|nr:mannitol-1-phosphate 5-dehydrogenase [Metasolibacillus sp.]MCT6922725.1 mannitol-1-phosphate 5-dehydrogenase [Metasolibacillus sp.]MCT6938936.1 mannitol-1-phosphate 5-dehydrogenase [Metasolibacillus sp.]